MRGPDQMLRQHAESVTAEILDPAEIAEGVRQIAHDIHLMLMKTTSSPAELIELERRIDELRVHTRGTRMIAIDRWLAKSLSTLRARISAEQTPLKEIYASARRCPDCVTSC